MKCCFLDREQSRRTDWCCVYGQEVYEIRKPQCLLGYGRLISVRLGPR